MSSRRVENLATKKYVDYKMKTTDYPQLKIFTNMGLFFGLISLILGCKTQPIDSSGSTTTLPANILFQDDFSDPNSGWYRLEIQEGTADYDNGYYKIKVNSKNTDFWSTPGQEFEDVVIEVNATKIRGPDDNNFGVICRYQDNKNFYFLTISSDGYYGIGKNIEGQQSLINAKQLLYDDAILQGNTTNRIMAVCSGSQLSLYVNELKLADATDTALKYGDVGLLAGTFLESGTEIHFDDFVVSAP